MINKKEENQLLKNKLLQLKSIKYFLIQKDNLVVSLIIRFKNLNLGFLFTKIKMIKLNQQDMMIWMYLDKKVQESNIQNI